MADSSPELEHVFQKFTFRIKSKLAQNLVLRNLSSLMKVEDFLKELSNLTSVPHDQMTLLAGFPPKRFPYDFSMTLGDLGLSNQDTIIVELDTTGFPGVVEDYVPDTHSLRAITAKTSLVSTSDIPQSRGGAAASEQGYTSSGGGGALLKKDLPKSAPRASTSTQPRRDSGPSSSAPKPPGGSSTYSSGGGNASERSQASSMATASELENIPLGAAGVMMRKVVASDNSCLFSAVTFCITGADGVSSADLRELIARTVLRDPVKYNEGFLGRSNLEYVEWISRFDSWGGGIELAILSEFYSLEINVMDTQHLRINRFGEDREYSSRIFLIYDGIHYDALYLECYDGSQMVTRFPASDTSVYDQVMDLGREANVSHHYTDVKNFTLRCDACSECFSGASEARVHADLTGHKDFSEYK